MRLFVPLALLLLFSACGGSKAVTDKPRDFEGGEHASSDPRKSNRQRVMSMFLEATQARLKGELPKAMQIYEATLREDPKNDASMFELAKIYHQGERPTEAVAMAKRAVATNGTNIWYRFLLADLSVQNNDLATATKAYQDIVKQWPDRYEVYFGLAGILAEQKKLSEAKQVYRDLETRFGSNEELVTREYDMLVTAGAFEDAKQLLEKAIAAHPDQTTYYGMLAEVYEQLGQKEKALETYQKALTLDPSDSMTRIALAQYYYDAGDRKEGFKHLKEAFADPDLDIDPKMQLLLGFFQMTQNGSDSSQDEMVKESHDLIAVMKKAHPQSGKPYSIEGDFFTREGKQKEARDAFREAVKYEQDKYPIWSALVQLDAEINDHAGLHEDASKAADLFPTQPEFHYYNGFALAQLKRYEEAIESFITGRDLVVDNKQLEAQFWSSLGDAYNEVKNYQKSDEAYEHVLAIDGDNVPVLNNYAYFLSERGENLEKAAAMSKKSNDLQPGVSTYIDTYAWVLYKQGKYAQAKTEQEKAIAAAEKPDGTLIEHYGDILFKLGDVAGALDQWKKAQDLGGASELIGRKVAEGKLVE